MHHSTLPLFISCTRPWKFAWHLLWSSTTESKNIVKLLAISQTIHTMCCEEDYFPKGKFKLFNSLFHSVYFVFPKSLFSIADLFTVRHLWVVCNEDKCCVVILRGRHSRRLAGLCSHILSAHCNFKSKQANSITLFGRRPNNELCNTCAVPFAIAELGPKCLEAAPTLKYGPLNSCITVLSVWVIKIFQCWASKHL